MTNLVIKDTYRHKDTEVWPILGGGQDNRLYLSLGGQITWFVWVWRTRWHAFILYKLELSFDSKYYWVITYTWKSDSVCNLANRMLFSDNCIENSQRKVAECIHYSVYRVQPFKYNLENVHFSVVLPKMSIEIPKSMYNTE